MTISAEQFNDERERLEEEDVEEKERRPNWLLLLLLLLVPICLCLVSQLAMLGFRQEGAEANLLSNLAANYQAWAYDQFEPINPELIGTIRADQLTQVAGIDFLPDLFPTSKFDPSTLIPDVQPTTAVPPTTSPPPTVPNTSPPPTVPNTSPPPTVVPTVPPTVAPTAVPTVAPTVPPPTVPPPPPTVPPPPIVISGQLLNDGTFNGVGVSVGAGVCDASMQGVTVQLYSGGPPPSGPVVQTVTTDAACTYEFTAALTPGNYTIRVLSGSFPIGLPEQTWDNGGARLGGVSGPLVADDHWYGVTYTGTAITNINFGFSFEAVVNENQTGQGSFEQALQNANLVAGAGVDRIAFDNSLAAYNINVPPGGFTALTNFNAAGTTIDGSTSNVTLNGAGFGGDGLDIQVNGVTVQDMTIQNFGLAGIRVDNADNITLTDLTLTGNVSSTNPNVGQIQILEDSNNIQINGATRITSGGGDGIRLADIGGSTIYPNNVTIDGVEVDNNSDAGITLRGSGHSVTYSSVHNNGTGPPGVNGGGVLVLNMGSVNNTIRYNSIYDNSGATGLGIDLGDPGNPDGVTFNDGFGDADTGPNDLLNFPSGLTYIGGPPRRITANLSNPAQGGFVDFYQVDPDPSSYGEGQTYLFTVQDNGPIDLNPALGAIDVDIDALGIGSGFDVTATVTDTNGNTSEFSLNLLIP